MIDGDLAHRYSTRGRDHLGDNVSSRIDKEGKATIRRPSHRGPILDGPEDQMGRVLVEEERADSSLVSAKPDVATEIHQKLSPGSSTFSSQPAENGLVAQEGPNDPLPSFEGRSARSRSVRPGFHPGNKPGFHPGNKPGFHPGYQSGFIVPLDLGVPRGKEIGGVGEGALRSLRVSPAESPHDDGGVQLRDHLGQNLPCVEGLLPIHGKGYRGLRENHQVNRAGMDPP